jgi:hypothetical protein
LLEVDQCLQLVEVVIPFWGGSFWSKAMRANLSALSLPRMGNLPTDVGRDPMYKEIEVIHKKGGEYFKSVKLKIGLK